MLARRCIEALHAPFHVEDIALNVEASVGLALAPHHGTDSGALLRAADVAMYQAKERKSGVVIDDPEVDVNTPTRLAMLGDLRRALQDGELVLHYQPKVSVSTLQVDGTDTALVRQAPELHHTRRLTPGRRGAAVVVVTPQPA